MIQPVFNSMLAFLLAKFMLNDIPHAAGLTPLEYEVMYHTTPLRNWEAIQKEGLLPQKLSEEVAEVVHIDSGVYLEKDLTEAHGWAGMLSGWEIPEEWTGEEIVTKFAILEVKVPKGTTLIVDPQVIDIGTQETPTAFITPQRIPPEHIKLLDISEWEIG